MIVISHRGNISGREPERENTPAYIDAALQAGYDVEIDVWFEKGAFFLGHDKADTETTLNYLSQPQLWLHAKNIAALFELRKANLHCFFHNIDDATLTSRGYIWTYPGKLLTPMSIAVLPERGDATELRCAGVCSDFISRYK